MNEIYTKINQQDILVGKTSTTNADVGATTDITTFYTSSIQKVASSSNYYISMYLSATATGSSDNQLFDIGYGNYSSADSESKANYK